MSDISSNSSFELISNTNCSDGDGPLIVSDISANEIQNANSSDVVKPKAEAPDVLAEQNPISLKKSTPGRKLNDIRVDIDQSSHSDNTNTRLREETRRKLHEQKLHDAEARGFRLGLCACFALMTCILVVGAVVFLFSTSEHHNASPIVQKRNVTMVNPEKAYNFPEEMKQKILDDVKIGQDEFNKFMEISESRKIIQGVTSIHQIPVYLRNKFIPDYSRFRGVSEFLQQTQTNGTVVEEYLYLCTPKIQVKDDILYVYFVNMYTLEIVEDFRIDDCEKFTKPCHKSHYVMKNGNLHIRETFVLNSQEYEFTRVYFIPPHELI